MGNKIAPIIEIAGSSIGMKRVKELDLSLTVYFNDLKNILRLVKYELSKQSFSAISEKYFGFMF